MVDMCLSSPLPCPDCGSLAKVSTVNEQRYAAIYTVICSVELCPLAIADGGHASIPSAIDAWNTRVELVLRRRRAATEHSFNPTPATLPPATAADLIALECDAIRDMLLDKNARYGNAALEPLGIAAKGVSAEAGIRVRIDDKLKRWQALPEGDDEDTVADLIGYLILLRVQRAMR